MSFQKQNLIKAERIASDLFAAAESNGLIVAGKSESQLNKELFRMAEEMFGIQKHWHKRIVRSGANTLCPYNENPPDLILQSDDIVFFDFGPIVEDWEADLGRTYVLGDDPIKHKLKNDVGLAWQLGKAFFDSKNSLIASEYFNYIRTISEEMGWEFGGEIAGHLIGHFPHEKLEPGNYSLYVHPENHNDMLLPDSNGHKREWILEIHLVDRHRQIGGFFEQVL